jgi:hypothetical protein
MQTTVPVTEIGEATFFAIPKRQQKTIHPVFHTGQIAGLPEGSMRAIYFPW